MKSTPFFPLLLSLISFILILLIIIAGTGSHVLTDFFFLKADTSNIKIPAALSNSTYLRDLSTLTGTDYVGSDATASSLGLGDSVTVSLLASCIEGSSTTSCTPAHLGSHFDPNSNLKLSGTSAASSVPSSLSTYGPVSTFLGIAYIFSAAFTLLAPTFNFCSFFFAPLALVSVVVSCLATTLLFAASIASLATFSSIKSAFNAALSGFGVSTSLGAKLFTLSWAAFILSLASSVLFILQHRRSGFSSFPRRRGKSPSDANDRKVAEGEANDADNNSTNNNGGDEEFAPKKLRFLSRIPTWKTQHNYGPIERQPVAVRPTGGDLPTDEDFDPLVRNVGHEGAEDEEEEQDLVDSGNAGQRGIAMQFLGGGGGSAGKHEPLRDVNTAYEPYRAT